MATTTKRDAWIGEDFHEYYEDRYRMATVAHHMLGDISRDNPALCAVRGETAEHYIGAFVTGFGFFDVKFPKATTRKLTPAEAERFRSLRVAIGDMVCDPMVIDECDVEETA